MPRNSFSGYRYLFCLLPRLHSHRDHLRFKFLTFYMIFPSYNTERNRADLSRADLATSGNHPRVGSRARRGGIYARNLHARRESQTVGLSLASRASSLSRDSASRARARRDKTGPFGSSSARPAREIEAINVSHLLQDARN